MKERQDMMNQTEKKSNYLEDDKLEKIKQCQKDIYEDIQITLSIKKIIHELITDENIEKIKQKFIKLYRD